MLNSEYWNKEGAQKVFTHPICSEWLTRIEKNDVILDFGCGYGRLTPDPKQAGFSNIFSYDPSDVLIERAIRENPGAIYTSNAVDLLGKSFNLILCFALFTSCPTCDEQNELISQIDEFTRESSQLYISDYEIGDNQNYHDRYEQRELGIYGCFASGNVVFRHHQPGHFDNLLSNWRRINERKISSKSLNGNDINVHQYLFVKV